MTAATARTPLVGADARTADVMTPPSAESSVSRYHPFVYLPCRGYPSGREGVDPNPVRQTPIRLFRRVWLDLGEG